MGVLNFGSEPDASPRSPFQNIKDDFKIVKEDLEAEKQNPGELFGSVKASAMRPRIPDENLDVLMRQYGGLAKSPLQTAPVKVAPVAPFDEGVPVFEGEDSFRRAMNHSRKASTPFNVAPPKSLETIQQANLPPISSYGEAFNKARTTGQRMFEYDGATMTTQKKGESVASWQASLGVSPVLATHKPQEFDVYSVLPDNLDEIKDMIKTHEGLKLASYKDSLGNRTIGYGHLISDGEDFKGPISREKADELFNADFDIHVEAATNVPGFHAAPDAVKAGLIDLTFNMGPNWYNKFPEFTAAMKEGDWTRAASELERSDWYHQVGKRAKKIVNMFRGAPASTDDEGSVDTSSNSMRPVKQYDRNTVLQDLNPESTIANRDEKIGPPEQLIGPQEEQETFFPKEFPELHAAETVARNVVGAVRDSVFPLTVNADPQRPTRHIPGTNRSFDLVGGIDLASNFVAPGAGLGIKTAIGAAEGVAKAGFPFAAIMAQTRRVAKGNKGARLFHATPITTMSELQGGRLSSGLDDISTLKTGTGGNRQGAGLYQAEQKDEALDYLSNPDFSEKLITVGGKPVDFYDLDVHKREVLDLLDYTNGDVVKARKTLADDVEFLTTSKDPDKRLMLNDAKRKLEILDDFDKQGVDVKYTGSIFESLLDDDKSNFLNLSTSLDAQANQIASKMKNLIGLDNWELLRSRGGATGADVYKMLVDQIGSREAASKAMREVGISGNIYFDEITQRVHEAVSWRGGDGDVVPRGMRQIEIHGEERAAVEARRRAIEYRRGVTEPRQGSHIPKKLRQKVPKEYEDEAKRLESIADALETGKVKPTYNYVLFDDANLTQVAHNGRELSTIGSPEFIQPTPRKYDYAPYAGPTYEQLPPTEVKKASQFFGNKSGEKSELGKIARDNPEDLKAAVKDRLKPAILDVETGSVLTGSSHPAIASEYSLLGDKGLIKETKYKTGFFDEGSGQFLDRKSTRNVTEALTGVRKGRILGTEDFNAATIGAPSLLGEGVGYSQSLPEALIYLQRAADLPAGVGKVKELKRTLGDLERMLESNREIKFDLSRYKKILAESLGETTSTIGASRSTLNQSPLKKKQFELSIDELDDAIKTEKQQDNLIEVNIFGEEGAKEYSKLQRRAHGTQNSKEADEAADRIKEMESGLSQEQERQLFGMDKSSDYLNADELVDLKRARERVSFVQTPEELASVLSNYANDIGEEGLYGTRSMAAFHEAYDLVNKNGWDPNEVTNNIVRAISKKYPDKEDALFMIKQFLASVENIKNASGPTGLKYLGEATSTIGAVKNMSVVLPPSNVAVAPFRLSAAAKSIKVSPYAEAKYIATRDEALKRLIPEVMSYPDHVKTHIGQSLTNLEKAYSLPVGHQRKLKRLKLWMSNLETALGYYPELKKVDLSRYKRAIIREANK